MPTRFISLDSAPAVMDDLRSFLFSRRDELWLPIAIARWASAEVIELDKRDWAERFPKAWYALYDVGTMYHDLFPEDFVPIRLSEAHFIFEVEHMAGPEVERYARQLDDPRCYDQSDPDLPAHKSYVLRQVQLHRLPRPGRMRRGWSARLSDERRFKQGGISAILTELDEASYDEAADMLDEFYDPARYDQDDLGIQMLRKRLTGSTLPQPGLGQLTGLIAGREDAA